MNEAEVSLAITTWVGELFDIPDAARYPYPVADKDGPFTTEQPDVVAVVERKRTGYPQNFLEQFPALELQQAVFVHVFDVAASLMLAVEDSETSAADVFGRLQEFGRQLEESALADDTLGDRVPMLSPVMAFDYSTVFIRTEGGATGRLLVCEFAVCEPIVAPE